MAVSGHLEEIRQSHEDRHYSRRRLSFQTLGQLPTGASANVLIHNGSTTGLLLQSGEDLSVGDRLEIDLPHAGPTTAEIVWASGDMFGCQFAGPISQAALSAVQLRSEAMPPEASPDRLGDGAGAGFGPRIRQLRMNRRLTLDNVAAALGVSKPTVWAWEQGKSRPQESRIAPLAEVLGVTPADLLASRGGDQERLIDQSRMRIAQAFGISPDKIRIMVEL